MSLGRVGIEDERKEGNIRMRGRKRLSDKGARGRSRQEKEDERKVVKFKFSRFMNNNEMGKL